MIASGIEVWEIKNFVDVSILGIFFIPLLHLHIELNLLVMEPAKLQKVLLPYTKTYRIWADESINAPSKIFNHTLANDPIIRILFNRCLATYGRYSLIRDENKIPFYTNFGRFLLQAS